MLVDGQLTALKHGNTHRLRVCLEVTWVVLAEKHLQDQASVLCVAPGRLRDQSPKSEPKTLLLTSSRGWETSGLLNLAVSHTAPLRLGASLRHARRTDVQEAIGGWTTRYTPFCADICLWTVNRATQAGTIQDEQVGM